MAVNRDILFRFLGDAKDLASASGKASRDLGGVRGAQDKVATGYSNVTRAIGALGLAIGAREIMTWIGDATTMAEQAGITAASLDEVLGPSADDLRLRFDDLREAMGFNVLEFDAISLSLSTLLTSSGVAADEASVLVGDLINMAGDLAAFNPSVGDAESAINDMTSAIRGEFDPLEKWGVKLSAAKVSAEKARLEGIDPMFASLSDSQQTMEAVISLIEQGLAPAMGSLEESMDTAATKTAILDTKMEDLQISIGEKLLPSEIEARQALLDLWETMEAMPEASFVDKIGLVGDAWDTLVGDIGLSNEEIREEWAMWRDAIIEVQHQIEESARILYNFLDDIPLNPFSGWSMPHFSFPSPPSWMGFATGGVVPGQRGKPQMAVVHGGERISTNRQQGGGGATVNINFNGVVGDPIAVAQQIKDLLEVAERNGG